MDFTYFEAVMAFFGLASIRDRLVRADDESDLDGGR
jgi:hypothetical protein